MSNVLGYYNPALYANTALIWLKNRLGMAGRVHRGYDAERASFNRGDTINIRRPGTFSAVSAPGSAQDIKAQSVAMTLDQWYEVRMTLSDKELAYTGQQIIDEHIGPATYALAAKMDTDLWALAQGGAAGSYGGAAYSSGGEAVNNIIQVRKIMQDNQVPVDDSPNMFFGISPKWEADVLREQAFTQYQGSNGTGVQTQITGDIGQRFGFSFFTSQQVPTATYIDFTDLAGAVNNSGGYAIGSTSIAVNGLGSEAKVDKGRTITFASHPTQTYVVTADATITSNAATLVIAPPLTTAVANTEVVTIQNKADNGTYYQNLAFHRHWAALAMARLPDHQDKANGLGIQCASVQDSSGVAIRYRLAYDNTNSALQAVLDVLYGVKVLNARLGCRMEIA